MDDGDRVTPQLSSEKWPEGKIPWWIKDAFPDGTVPRLQAPLEGQAEVDVAIVGGGFTGLWTALALRQKRHSIGVAVVEAQFCGSGASGMNGGFCHGYWDALPRLLQDFGEADALAIARAGSLAQEHVANFCADFAPEADFRSSGRIKLATSREQRARFSEYLRIFERYGLSDKIRLATGEEIASACRLPSCDSGIHFMETATVQPAKLVLALKREALGRGIRLYERSPVEAVRKVGDRYVLRTPGGTLLAGDVVLASNARLARHPFLRSKLTNFSSYVLATRPIPDKLKSIAWNTDIGFSTGKMFMNWFRRTSDDRIVFGTGGGPIGFNGAFNGSLLNHRRTYDRLVADFLKLFPVCSASDVAHQWAGAVELSVDRLPFFGTIPGTRIHYGCGYSGHGVNATWIGGQILSELVLDSEPRWSSLPLRTRNVPDWPAEPFRYLGGRFFRSGLMSYDDALEAGQPPSAFALLVHKLSKIGPVRLGAR